MVLTDYSLRFGADPPVVDGLNLRIGPGEATGIVGPSGSGKSLTARAIAGILPAGAREQGALIRRPGLRTAMIFQEPLAALNPVHRCGDQLLESIRHLRPDLRGAAARRNCRDEWLDRVELGGPDRPRILRAYPHQLSGGQRQRILIAMALCGRPDLLLADEPTTALDTITQAEILRLLDRLRRDLGMALLFITHDTALLAGLVDRTLHFRSGRVQEPPRTERTTLPLSSPPELGDSPQQATRYPKTPRYPQLPEPPDGTTESAGGAPRLSVRNLSVVFPPPPTLPWRSAAPPTPAVRDLSLRARPGEWLALVGPSGCGKTTTGRCLAGLQPARAGTLQLGATSYDLRTARPRPGVQLIFQDPYGSLNPRHRVSRILGEARRVSRHPESPAELLAAVGLGADYLRRRPAHLSGGERQRVAIARSLAAAPQLLICDEAVSALDAPLRRGVLDLLDRLRRERGITLLFISHDLGAVAERADRVLVMDGGQIVERAAPADLLARPAHPLTRRLIAAATPKVGPR